MPPDAFATDGEGATEGRMQRFVAALLTAKGALVEPVEPEGLDVLLPGSVQGALELAEVDRLGFGPVQPPGARRVGLEGDWLDRFGRLLGEQGRSARRVLVPELRSLGSPERLLEQQLVLDNATYRLLGVQPAWTRYLLLDFRFSATSDEKRDGVLQLGINLGTGALPDAVLARVLPELNAQADDPAGPGRGGAPAELERGPGAGADDPCAAAAAGRSPGAVRQRVATAVRAGPGTAVWLPQRPLPRSYVPDR